MTSNTTSRRTFLKTGAMAAVPAMAVGLPAAAAAADDSKAALARLQDERAIEGLTRDAVRAFNRGEAGELFGRSVARVALDAEDVPALAVEGDVATARFACTVDTAHALEGQGTLVQMARLQGNAATTSTTGKTLLARFARQDGTWTLAGLDLA